MLKTIVIHSRQVNAYGKKFISSSAKIGNNYFKIKFTQTCERTPKERGFYELTFDTANASIENGKKYINKNGYEAIGNATIWVRKITDIRKFTDQEMAEINEAKFEGIFADEE